MKYILLFLPFIFACQAQPTIGGTVKFAGDNEPMKAVEIVVTGDTYTTQTTDANGAFNFALDAGTYTITPVKRCDTLQGIDAQDRVLIQQHLIAVTPLNQWQKFAADVNQNGNMSSHDAYIVQAATLGVSDARQIVGGWWTFCPADYVAPSVDGFFVPQYPTSVTITVGDDGAVVDFVAFRRGDVNMNALQQ